MDSTVELVASEQTQDEFGIWQEKQSTRQVFCRVDSVTRSEFFSGGRNGLNPEFKFTMFHGDFCGEEELIYCNKRYAIYRVFRRSGNDYIELYAERKGGTNGNENAN